MSALSDALRRSTSLFKALISRLKIPENVGDLSSLRVVAFILLAVIGLHYLDFISINIGPFSTRGAIYVDSPEIYTRERLVNDRYDQDFWLREQLGKLDDTTNLVTATQDERVSGGIGGDTRSGSTNSTAPGEGRGSQRQPDSGGAVSSDESDRRDPPAEDFPALPFDQDFRIRAAIRDTIRQLMLENMLDDRHDLTGNSVYGLKFDTTVIPGSNTRERAFVRVMLVVKDPFKIDQNKLERLPDGVDEKELPPHVRAFFATPEAQVFSPGGALHGPNRLYQVWLGSIADRLNTYMAKKFRSDDFMAQCTNKKDDKTKMYQLVKEVIRENIELVLGTVGKRILDITQESSTEEFSNYKIELADPLRRFMSLDYKWTTNGSLCDVPLIFNVVEKEDIVYAFEKEEKEDWRDSQKGDYYMVGRTPKERVLAVKKISSQKGGPVIPSYGVNDAVIDLACKRNQKWCDDKGENRYLKVPSGLFNLIESIGKRDVYSYAVFPKNEVAGILSSSAVDVALSENAPGPSWFSFVRGLRESQIESVLVGFGDGSGGYQEDREKPDEQGLGGDGIQFGWVMSSRGKMGPTQKTELALISVPAWITELTLKVATGWLDRNANEEVDKRFELQVPVPPDFEAFDALLDEVVQLQRNPKILDTLMDANLKVSACEKAKILIPGSRLWRSATVTLGAQKADRITVLPNMEGIIAEFDPVEIPPVSGTGKTSKVKLRVWTSEGADTAEKDVDIQAPSNGDGRACPSDEKTVARMPDPSVTFIP